MGEQINNYSTILGVGINDADYVVKVSPTVGRNADGTRIRKLEWVCPFYAVWMGMLARCYSKKNLKRRPSYKGCSVCEEWLRFSKFKTWMEQQDWQGKQLDKDLLVRGNKIYSPETCVFVSAEVNGFIRESFGSRGSWPIGVCWSKQHEKFKASLSKGSNKRWNIGLFNTPEEAHEAWLKAKLSLAYELASRQTDQRVAQAIIEFYENYENTQNDKN